MRTLRRTVLYTITIISTVKAAILGKSPKHDKDLRKMMKRAAAIALAVALVGGSFGAGSYVSNHYGAVAQASETESESETEGTEASTVATASTADGTTYSVQEIVQAMPVHGSYYK